MLMGQSESPKSFCFDKTILAGSWTLWFLPLNTAQSLPKVSGFWIPLGMQTELKRHFHGLEHPPAALLQQAELLVKSSQTSKHKCQ